MDLETQSRECIGRLEPDGRPVMSKPAVEFIREHGKRSLISLGCGDQLNRIDNHVRIFVKCKLEYYIGIDSVPKAECNLHSAFTDPDTVKPLLFSYFDGKPELFLERVKIFSSTYVEELAGMQCKVVVCQRVLPFRHWEEIIQSMSPLLVLQEDLKGCELQILERKLYKKTFPGIIHYQLQPFMPNPFIPRERNIILWRRRDYFPCRHDMEPWWRRFLFRCYHTARV